MVGQLVRQARESRGLTQRKLAEASGVDQPNISAIENDRRQPSAETLVELLAGCGYELVAVCGRQVIRLPLRREDEAGDVPLDPPLDVPVETRAELMDGALGLVDAILLGE